jgi:hypothetical protein
MVFVLKSFSDYHQFLIVFAGWGLSLIVTLIAALIGKRIESKKLNEPYQLSRDLKSTNIAMFLSGVLAYFTTFVASVFLINARHDYFGQFFSQDGGFITYDLIISICIFFIVKKNYRSFWYVPVIANLGGILAVFVIHYFDHPLEFTYIFAGWGLSVIVTIIAAIIGYRIESRKLKEIPKSS